MLLSSPFLGALLAVLTWPFPNLTPTYGLDPSWVAGLYMAGERGLDAGTQIVFSYGPLGFLGLPNLFEIGMGRLAFAWSALVQILFCTALLWGSRRAFGLLVGLAVTAFAAATPIGDPILIAAAVIGAAALLGEWSARARLTLAAGAGALAGMQLLGSLRAGPTLVAMAVAVLLGLPDRRRTFPVFFAALVVTFMAFWFITGQALANIDDYAVNTANVVGDYSAAMVAVYPSRWWQTPATAVGLATVAALCIAAVWRRDNMRRLGLVLMVAAVSFLMFKHAVVRYSPGNSGVFMAALLGIGLALVPYVRRPLAIAAVIVLAGITYVGNEEAIGTRLDFRQRAETFQAELETVALPGHAEDAQQRGREEMIATYGLSPAEVALLRSGTVHVAPWEAGAAWAYDLNWDPLPVFQQYSAFTPRLDQLNAAKLESSSAPELILWQNTTTFDPNAINVPGAIDARWPAFESPAQMVQMFCRYRVVRWDEEWAILRHSPNRCSRERPLATVTTGNSEGVHLPPTRPNEALIVRVDGLAVSGLERLRTLLFRASGRIAVIEGNPWNMVGETAADGLLVRVPRWADYPGLYRLGRDISEIGFGRAPGFLTGVDGSTKLTLHFSALPLDRSAVLPRAAAQKRRVQRSIR
ncbi:MAG: hypothetical protein QOF85_1258 [Solirubrobacterales bacterium]|nr:hypothetical protein [Solirubrobacterales bacterium]